MLLIKIITTVFITIFITACGGESSSSSVPSDSLGIEQNEQDGITATNPWEGIDIAPMTRAEWDSEYPKIGTLAKYDSESRTYTVEKDGVVIMSRTMVGADICPSQASGLTAGNVDEDREHYLFNCKKSEPRLHYYVILNKDFEPIYTSNNFEKDWDGYLYDGKLIIPGNQKESPLLRAIDYTSPSPVLTTILDVPPPSGFSANRVYPLGDGTYVFDDGSAAVTYKSLANYRYESETDAMALLSADGSVKISLNIGKLVDATNNHFGQEGTRNTLDPIKGKRLVKKGENGEFKLFLTDNYVLKVPEDKLERLEAIVNTPENLPGNVLSCSTYSDLCVTYVFENQQDKTSYLPDCSIPVSACPSENLVYTCDVTNGTPQATLNGTPGGVEYTFYLYAPSYTPSRAATSCSEAQSL